VVGGLAPAAPGYRIVRFAPQPGGGLTSASARHRTPYGEASIAWQVEADHLVVDVRVPVGATGVLELPGLPPETLAHGTHHRETSAVIAVG
jgi:alpha-L-rhamnosidase